MKRSQKKSTSKPSGNVHTALAVNESWLSLRGIAAIALSTGAGVVLFFMLTTTAMFAQSSSSTSNTTATQSDRSSAVLGASMMVADLSELTVEMSKPFESAGNRMVQNLVHRVWNGALPEARLTAITLHNLISTDGSDPRLMQAQNEPANPQPVDDPPPSAIPPVFAGIAVAAIVLVVGGSILYWNFSRRQVQKFYALRREKERLLTEIATLDDLHDQGRMDDETWSKERVALMSLLREVRSKLEQAPQGGRRR